MTAATTTPEDLNGLIEQAIPVAHSMGLRIVLLEPGRVAAEAPLEGNGNHFGTMYAGVLFAVAEILGGAICTATFEMEGRYPLVKDLRIRFRRPATAAVRAEASLDAGTVERVEREVSERGRAEFTLDAVVTDPDGVEVASTTGTYQVRELP